VLSVRKASGGRQATRFLIDTDRAERREICMDSKKLWRRSDGPGWSGSVAAVYCCLDDSMETSLARAATAAAAVGKLEENSAARRENITVAKMCQKPPCLCRTPRSQPTVIKGKKIYTGYSAVPLSERTKLQKRSDIAWHALSKDFSFTCHSRVYPRME